MWLGSKGVVCTNSLATSFTCLLLNSTCIWEFWNLFCNKRLQAKIIHPNSLMSSASELTQSTTLLESNANSPLSNWWSNTHCNVVYNPTTSPTSTSHGGENQSVLASKNSPAPFPSQPCSAANKRKHQCYIYTYQLLFFSMFPPLPV